MNGSPPWVAVAVFLAAYVVITARDRRITRLGRPGGALVGAFLMVLTGVLTPDEAWRAIEPNTLVLLFGMMVLAAYLDVAGFFGWAAARVLGWCRSPVALLHALIWASGGLSAVLVNDTVCLLLTPLVLLS